MSCVYFHTPDHTAKLRGPERAYAGGLTADLALAVLDPGARAEQLLRFVAPGHYMHRVDRTRPGWAAYWAQSYGVSFSVGGDDGLISWRGRPLRSFTIGLNTALAVGNDQIRLLARLHGQCELHAWVDGPNRAWLAEIILRGRAMGVYRAEMGWEDVAHLLQRSDRDPVVMSYSVTESFPYPGTSLTRPAWPEGVDERWEALTAEQQRAYEEHTDGWYELTNEEQWRQGVEWLRAVEDRGLELRPDEWEFPDYHFGNGLTAFDVIAPDGDDRLDRTLGLMTA